MLFLCSNPALLPPLTQPAQTVRPRILIRIQPGRKTSLTSNIVIHQRNNTRYLLSSYDFEQIIIFPLYCGTVLRNLMHKCVIHAHFNEQNKQTIRKEIYKHFPLHHLFVNRFRILTKAAGIFTNV